jgi:UDP-N-acetylglucosamine 2-epimerase
MKVATIVGARPQFIKAAAVSRAVFEYNENISSRSSRIAEVIVHTGQHYDDNMSDVFFQELQIPKPNYYLDIHGLSHGAMTGQMMEKIEDVLLKERPDMVLVYGDTNSTLAGCLAAVKLHIPVAHVEAGLRSFNRRMPEEINRLLTDHVSSWLFCPTDTAVRNLEAEGIKEGVFHVGDVMFDAFLFSAKLATENSSILSDLQLEPKSFYLATVHRQENTADADKLSGLFKAFEAIGSREHPFVIPLHPRTRQVLDKENVGRKLNSALRVISPVSYLDMIALELNARMIFTDSGGVQKEGYFARTPCITLRDETEWVETVETGMNVLTGVEKQSVEKGFRKMSAKKQEPGPLLFGNGEAGKRIVGLLHSFRAK